MKDWIAGHKKAIIRSQLAANIAFSEWHKICFCEIAKSVVVTNENQVSEWEREREGEKKKKQKKKKKEKTNCVQWMTHRM